jgi:hypothetical protein
MRASRGRCSSRTAGTRGGTTASTGAAPTSSGRNRSRAKSRATPTCSAPAATWPRNPVEAGLWAEPFEWPWSSVAAKAGLEPARMRLDLEPLRSAFGEGRELARPLPELHRGTPERADARTRTGDPFITSVDQLSRGVVGGREKRHGSGISTPPRWRPKTGDGNPVDPR